MTSDLLPMNSELTDIFEEMIYLAQGEDVGSGDITSNLIIPADSIGSFVFSAREEIIFCGAGVIKAAFPQAEIKFKDGDKIPSGAVIAKVSGNVREILLKERVVLNLIQHLSGIATETAKYVAAVKGTKAKILDTRKTIPFIRQMQKYAVTCGGGQNHRMGLYDAVLIKDNHIKAAGGIAAALEKVAPLKGKIQIEIECDSIEQVKEALAGKPDIILADNMSLEQLKETVQIVAGKCKIEASGNVNLQTVADIAATGVDSISVGKLTHSVKAVDIGLDQI